MTVIDKDLLSTDRAEVIQQAMTHIGRAIEMKRKVLGLRQSDLAEMSGVPSAKISKVETASGNSYLSTILSLLDSVGLLNAVLDSLPSPDEEVSMKTRIRQPHPVEKQRLESYERATKLFSASQFEALITVDPNALVPVGAPAASRLRKRGYATRKYEHQVLGSCYLAATVDSVRHSQFIFDTEQGSIGGYKYLDITVAVSMLSEKTADMIDVVGNQLIDYLNKQIDSFRIYITSLNFDHEATAHVVKMNDAPIESVYIYEKICNLIDGEQWISE